MNLVHDLVHHGPRIRTKSIHRRWWCTLATIQWLRLDDGDRLDCFVSKMLSKSEFGCQHHCNRLLVVVRWQFYIGDLMVMIDSRCWWPFHYVGDFYRYFGDFFNKLYQSPTSQSWQHILSPTPINWTSIRRHEKPYITEDRWTRLRTFNSKKLNSIK